MDPSGENPPAVELNPAQKQTQLKSIYASLPETSALATKQNGPGHFTFDIPYGGVTDEEKSTRLVEALGVRIENSVTNKELPRIKFEELRQLLSTAKIIPLLKEQIESTFKHSFAFGITREAEEQDTSGLFGIIGATESSNQNEGIFSLDPTVRSNIDTSFLNKIKAAIEMKKGFIEQSIKDGNNDRVAIFKENIDQLQARLTRGRKEFQELYGKEPTLI